jgi:hypothetical protein
MKNVFVSFIFLLTISICAMGEAQDLIAAKILDVQAFSQAGAPVIAPNNGHPVVIPISKDMFSLTLAIGYMSYTGRYSQSRHLKPADLIVGDSLQARIDGKHMLVMMPNGKLMKAEIIRKERLKPN